VSFFKNIPFFFGIKKKKLVKKKTEKIVRSKTFLSGETFSRLRGKTQYISSKEKKAAFFFFFFGVGLVNCH
jgi:hypothetical protein